MPFHMGFAEIMVVLAIVLLLFGAKRLPELAAGLGKGIKSFKKGLQDEAEPLPPPDETGQVPSAPRKLRQPDERV